MYLHLVPNHTHLLGEGVTKWMTDTVRENMWAALEERQEVVGCEVHPWENASRERRLAKGLALRGGRAVCLCRRINVEVKECGEEGKS